MKRLIILALGTVLCANAALAQYYKAGNDRFSVKVQPFVGDYLDKHNNMKIINPTLPSGFNLGFELPSSQQRPWQQYLNNSTAGVGITYMDMGDKVMGHTVSIYPYIVLNCLRREHVELGIKLAAGLGYCTESYWTNTLDTDTDDPTANYTFGSNLNAYLTGGLNFNFPINRNIALNAELGFAHMSNGRIKEPNKGANILYGGIGAIATVNPEKEKEPIRFPSLPYRWSLNITGAVGSQNADMADEKNFFISTFHAGAIYNVTNWYGVGLGADVFFNDAIGAESNRGLFRTDITYKQRDKIRAGVSLNNELQFGRVTAMVDWGIYLYNPARHCYNSDHPIYGYGKRPLFYKGEGAGSDEAWNYIRFGVKCRVWDNLYVQALAKTHYHIAEMIEFGVGYQIPFISKNKRQNDKDIIFHNREGWWNNY